MKSSGLQTPPTNEHAGELAVRALAPGEAPALTRCFRRCYGDTYPAGEFYDAEAIRRRLADGSLRSVAAVTAAGEIVGHTALSVRHPGARVAEAGNTVVDPAYRGRGLLAELGLALAERCHADGFAGFVHYPTTAHELMQRASVKTGGVETGLMLDYVASGAEYLGIEERPAGRLAATVVYQPITALPPGEVILPERYRALLEELYEALGAERTFGRGRPPAGRSSIRTAASAREGILRHSVEAIGADLAEQAAPPAGTPLTLIDLPLADPGAGHAVEALTRSGFCFCGLLPEFAAADVLRLQLLGEDAFGARRPNLANAGARRLLDYIAADAAR
jgi:GNAT superfamily N-acetyltransferase